MISLNSSFSLVKSAFLWVKPGLRQVLGPELQEAVQRPLHGLVGRGQLINSWFTLNVSRGWVPRCPQVCSNLQNMHTD